MAKKASKSKKGKKQESQEQENQKGLRNYPLRDSLVVDRKLFTISGGQNANGRFIQIVETVRNRNNFMFINIDSINPTTGERGVNMLIEKLQQMTDEVLKKFPDKSVPTEAVVEQAA